MPANYQSKPHSVTGSRIQKVEPLLARGQMLGPDSGLTLILDDGSTQKWIAEKDGHVPVPGDAFVTDAELKLSFIVPAGKFNELFAEV